MGFIPGAEGSKTILTDGVQVDHISENTVGHGSRVKGISDPTTYPVLIGDVGEIIAATPVNVLLTNNASSDAASLALTSGSWLVYGKIYFERVTGSDLMTQVRASIGTSSATHHLPSQGFLNVATTDAVCPTATPRAVTSNVPFTVYLVASVALAVTSTVRANGTNTSLFAVRIA